MVRKLQVPYIAGNFLTIERAVSFSRRFLLQGDNTHGILTSRFHLHSLYSELVTK